HAALLQGHPEPHRGQDARDETDLRARVPALGPAPVCRAGWQPPARVRGVRDACVRGSMLLLQPPPRGRTQTGQRGKKAGSGWRLARRTAEPQNRRTTEGGRKFPGSPILRFPDSRPEALRATPFPCPIVPSSRLRTPWCSLTTKSVNTCARSRRVAVSRCEAAPCRRTSSSAYPRAAGCIRHATSRSGSSV